MKTEIKPLTSIRGVAAVLVMIYHYHQLDNMGSAALTDFVKKGYLWVDLFFILSGLVMAITYSEKFAGKYSWKEHKDFLLLRIGRIYPMYIFVTALISLYSLVIYRGFSDVHRPAVNLDNPLFHHITNIFMIQGWFGGKSIGGPTWSISTEWAVYLVFPLLVNLAVSARKQISMILALTAVIILFYITRGYEAGNPARNGELDLYAGNYFPLLRCISGFCLGLLAFRVAKTNKFSFVYSDIATGIVIISMIALMSLGVNDLLIYPTLILLVFALYGNTGYVASFFSNKVFYILGVLSYSIYLLHHHFLVLLTQLQLRLPAYMPENIANITAAAIVYSLVFAGAGFCYNFIEKPSRKWFRNLRA